MNCFGSKGEVGRSRAEFRDVCEMSHIFQSVHPVDKEQGKGFSDRKSHIESLGCESVGSLERHRVV